MTSDKIRENDNQNKQYFFHKLIFKVIYFCFLIILIHCPVNSKELILNSSLKRDSKILKNQITYSRANLYYLETLLNLGVDHSYQCALEYKQDTTSDYFKRVTFTSLQYFLMTESMKWYAAYSVQAEISKDDFKKNILQLRNNNCSRNISFISWTYIIKEWLSLYKIFKKNPQYIDFNYDNFYPHKLLSKFNLKRTQLFFNFSEDIFKRSCMWNSNIKNISTLKSFFSNPVIFELLIQKMSGKKFVYEQKKINLLHEGGDFKKDNNSGIFISCSDSICRTTTRRRFSKDVGRKVMNNFTSSLYQIYCKYKKKNINFYDHLLNTFFISKRTGVPDYLFIGLDKKTINEIHLSNLINNYTDPIINKYIKGLNDFLYFEEPLEYKIMPSQNIFKINKKFNIHINVNYGDLDRLFYRTGKFTLQYKFIIHRKIISWIKKTIKLKDTDNTYKTKKQHIRRLTIMIQNNIKKIYNLIQYPPPLKKLSSMIAKKLYNEINNYTVNINLLPKIIEVPIYFHYGVFALEYIGNK